MFLKITTRSFKTILGNYFLSFLLALFLHYSIGLFEKQKDFLEFNSFALKHLDLLEEGKLIKVEKYIDNGIKNKNSLFITYTDKERSLSLEANNEEKPLQNQKLVPSFFSNENFESSAVRIKGASISSDENFILFNTTFQKEKQTVAFNFYYFGEKMPVSAQSLLSKKSSFLETEMDDLLLYASKKMFAFGTALRKLRLVGENSGVYHSFSSPTSETLPGIESAFLILETKFYYLVLSIVVFVFSSVLTVFHKLRTKRVVFFLELMGSDLCSQYFVFLILALVFSMPTNTVALLVLKKLDKTKSVALLCFSFLVMLSSAFSFDTIMVTVNTAETMLWRTLFFCLWTALVTLENTWLNFESYFLNVARLFLNPLLGLMYFQRTYTNWNVPFSLFETKTVSNCSNLATFLGTSAALLVYFLLGILFFLNSKKFFFSSLSLIELFWWSVDFIKERKKKDSVYKKVNSADARPTINRVVLAGVNKFYQRNNSQSEALKDFSLCSEVGEKLVLLGHNGAGKTTLLEILAGIVSKTAGKIYFGKKELVNAKDRIGRVSYCPQTTVCLEDFSVVENLETVNALFATKTKKKIDRAFQKEVLEVLDLDQQRNKKYNELSGGQKRKVGLALALVTKPVLVILDEPTTGVDILSRKKILSFLQERMIDSTVILSTHLVEEAEAFGNRIILMSKGALVAAGSVEQLKTKYNIKGHRLVLNYRSEEKNKEFVAEFSKVKLLEKRKKRNVFSVEFTDHYDLIDFYEKVETVKERLEIESISVKPATIEEIFNKDELRENKKDVFLVETASNKQMSFLRNKQGNKPTLLRVVWAMLLRRVFDLVTNFRSLLLSFLIFVFTVVLVSKSEEQIFELVDLTEFKAFIPKQRFKITTHFQKELFNKFETFLKKEFPSASELFSLENRTLAQMGNADLFVNEKIISSTDQFLKEIKNDSPIDIDSFKYLSLKDAHFNSLFAIPNNENKFMLVFDFKVSNNKSNVLLPFLTVWQNFLLQETLKDKKETAPDLLNGLQNEKIEIKFFDLFGGKENKGTSNEVTNYVMRFFLLSMGMFLFSLVREYQKNEYLTNSRNLFAAYGLPKVGSVLFDVFFDSVFSFILVAVPFLLFNKIENSSTCKCLFAFYVSSIATFSFLYCLVLVCKNGLVVHTVSSLLFVCAVIAPAFVMIVENLLKKNLFWIFYFNPFMGFTIALIYLLGSPSSVVELEWLQKKVFLKHFIMKNKSFLYIENLFGKEPPIEFVTKNSVLLFFVSLMFIILVESGVGVLLASWLHRKKIKKILRNTINQKNTNEITIEREHLRVVDKIAYRDFKNNVLFNGISKVYNGLWSCEEKPVLTEFNLSIEMKESVAVLGPNGSGKSTLFKCVVNEVVPSVGICLVNGKKTNKLFKNTLPEIAYTPQTESLPPNWTPLMVFRMNALLRNFVVCDCPVVATNIATIVGLGTNAVKPLRSLSGGNKRKVVVGLSLLGGSFAVLDEPTSGVDFTNSRDIWRFLKSVAENKAVCLASHILQETEELCDRIVLVKEGQAVAIGSAETLKQKLGNTYEVTIKLQNDKQTQNCIALFKKQFGSVTWQVSNNLKVFVGKQCTDLISLIKFVAENRKELEIETFEVGEESLDNILANL